MLLTVANKLKMHLLQEEHLVPILNQPHHCLTEHLCPFNHQHLLVHQHINRLLLISRLLLVVLYVLVTVPHLAQMPRNYRPRVIFVVVLLDVCGQLIGCEKVAALQSLVNEVLDFEGFLVLAFLELGLDQRSALDFVRFLELFVLVEDCGVAESKLLADLLEFDLAVGVSLVLLEHLVHLLELF
jgi:hypothetical protein